MSELDTIDITEIFENDVINETTLSELLSHTNRSTFPAQANKQDLIRWLKENSKWLILLQNAYRNRYNVNYAINGDFQVWQRGTSFEYNGGSPIFSADNWFGRRGSSHPNLIYLQQESDLEEFKYFLRNQIIAGDTLSGEIALSQVIDTKTVRFLAGKDITLSLWIRLGSDYADTGDNKIDFRIRYSTTEYEQGNPNAEEDLKNPFALSFLSYTGGNPQSTTDKNIWQKIIVNYTIPLDAQTLLLSLTTGSLPTSAKGSNFYVDIAGVKLEVGDHNTKFISRPAGQESAICKSYFDLNKFAKINTIKLEYLSATTLKVKAGIINSDDNSKFINLSNDFVIDLTTTGVGGLANNAVIPTNDFLYIWICQKQDGTTSCITDSLPNGTNAFIDIEDEGYTSKKFCGVWKTEDATTNLTNDLINIKPAKYIRKTKTYSTMPNATTSKQLYTIDIPELECYLNLGLFSETNNASLAVYHPDESEWNGDIYGQGFNGLHNAEGLSDDRIHGSCYCYSNSNKQIGANSYITADVYLSVMAFDILDLL